MKTIKKAFTLLAMVCVTFANAQWNDDTALNTLVSNSVTEDMQAIGTADGETYVVYWKTVAAPTNYELRMQVLDADGNQTLGAEGVLVNDQIPMSTSTATWKIVLDAEENIYIGITGTGAGELGFVFKLDSEGNHLWGDNGVNVGGGYVVTPFPLSNGDAIVSWLNPSNGQATMQRYDSTGSAVWANTQTISAGSGAHAPANFFEIDSGDFILVFHKLIGGINSNLYAQRYNENGDEQWSNATQLSNKQTRFNRIYSGGQQGDAIFMSTSSPNGTRFDAYLQRVNADGSLPWGINGVDFDTNVTVNEGDVTMAVDVSTASIYAVSNYSNASQNMNGMFVQKFDSSTGARLFADTAKEIFAIGEDRVQVGPLHLAGNTPWFLIKSGTDNGASPTTLESIYLDADGEYVWNEETRPVATFAANKSRIQYTAPANGLSVAVFIEDKGDGNKIYAQKNEGAPLSVNEFTQDTFKISYNNPVSNILSLQSTTNISEAYLYTLKGGLVKKEIGEGQTMIINVNSLALGVYVLHIYSEKGAVASYKILKK